MKILTKEQFAKMPDGTLFCTCVDSAFTGQPEVKVHDRPTGKTWLYTLDIMPWLADGKMGFQECDGYTSGGEIETEENCVDDSTIDYDNGTLFAVFSKQEINEMIQRLQNAKGY